VDNATPHQTSYSLLHKKTHLIYGFLMIHRYRTHLFCSTKISKMNLTFSFFHQVNQSNLQVIKVTNLFLQATKKVINIYTWEKNHYNEMSPWNTRGRMTSPLIYMYTRDRMTSP